MRSGFREVFSATFEKYGRAGVHTLNEQIGFPLGGCPQCGSDEPIMRNECLTCGSRINQEKKAG